jgi:hypothetical protein
MGTKRPPNVWEGIISDIAPPSAFNALRGLPTRFANFLIREAWRNVWDKRKQAWLWYAGLSDPIRQTIDRLLSDGLTEGLISSFRALPDILRPESGSVEVVTGKGGHLDVHIEGNVLDATVSLRDKRVSIDVDLTKLRNRVVQEILDRLHKSLRDRDHHEDDDDTEEEDLSSEEEEETSTESESPDLAQDREWGDIFDECMLYPHAGETSYDTRRRCLDYARRMSLQR